ncbi:hypothetical protein D3C73_1220280 [compost metagenome]
MNIDDLLMGEHLDAPACTFQALLQVLAGLFLAVGGEFDDVETLFLDMDLIQPGDQRRFAEQEHVRAPLRDTCRQLQQRLECRLVELFRIVDQ